MNIAALFRCSVLLVRSIHSRVALVFASSRYKYIDDNYCYLSYRNILSQSYVLLRDQIAREVYDGSLRMCW